MKRCAQPEEDIPIAEFIPVDLFEIVIFGGTGDLSQRKLLPALFHRWKDGQVPEGSRIIGSARTDMDTDGYVAFAKEACQRAQGEDWKESEWTEFAKLLDYQALDATDPKADWKELKGKLSKNVPVRVFYLATSPRLYVEICGAVSRAGLITPDTRVVLEKPIGTNLASAQEINEGVCAYFDEHQIYRIDHYLGKETVQNLMVLRFANLLMEPVWNRAAVDHVQITVAEDLGLEGRAGYYDRSGALRDMVQNHLLQLLCLTAMEPPATLEGDDVRTEKIKVLQALRRFTPAMAEKNSVRGQYTAGMVKGKPVKGYLEELEDGQSDTETFVAIKTEIENWRWAGVPFYLRTGKRMASRRSDIVIQFKPVPHSIFGDSETQANRLVIRLQPDEGVRLFVQIKEPGPGGLRIKSLPLNLSYAENFTVRYPDAYERLLMDVVRGNLALFMRRDEVEAAWAWIDELIEAWEEKELQVESYAAGSDGPVSSAVMMERDSRKWWGQ
ncbi:MAG: glucose-6-phosphate dehydrogenase [Hyphomonadaceae bacterium]|nr:glucose-6-phosphate dehydrogenase [Hyphomonadaceae bacterium]